MNRRTFLQNTAFLSTLAGASTMLPMSSSAQESTQSKTGRLHIAVNQYTANNFFHRDEKNFWNELATLKSCDVDGFEPTIGSAEEAESVGKRLKDAGLAMRSVYVGGNLHDRGEADKTIERILATAEKTKEFETQFLIYNPAPKGGKSDEELILQSKKVDELGAKLRGLGITLSLHYHTTELEFGGREFHHLLCGTDPANFSLCMEQHWSYRACGNSQVALFDHFKLYSSRIATTHLRQSIDNVWSEWYGDGDIDSKRLAAELKKLPKLPHIVLEQAAEKGTPKTMTSVDVFKKSVAYIRAIFS